ncbi:MAG: peptidoglycan recognition protein family protein [Lachnospiraceae bacterium]|nr:peptidoglycan recognition protein family protein [Lachnospiraceae bacterium]
MSEGRYKTEKSTHRIGKRRKHITKEERKRQIGRRVAAVVGGIAAVIAIGAVVFCLREGSPMPVARRNYGEYDIGNPTRQVERPELDVQLLTVNEYSRPGTPADQIRSVVVHYTANPGSTAQNNRDYFENLKDTQETKVSSNFIVGLEGEIIQCVPTAEVAYASNSRNHDSVSIECCHPDETGKFEDATYQSLVELVAFLCGKFDLGMDDIIRHYDVTGKECPKYFVDYEDEWEAFKHDVAKYIQENGK